MVKINESFGAVAKEYQKYRSSYDLRTYKLLASLLGGAKKHYKILDIGCGTGKSTEPLLKFFKKSEIVGCDPDKEMLREAQLSATNLKLPIKYVEGWAEKLPFKDASFDAVIAGTAFHWFGNVGALKEIRRALKKDGILFVFWKLYIENDGLVDWGRLARKYKWKRPAVKFKNNSKLLKNIFQKGGFNKIKINRIPFAEKKTAEEMIGGFKTNSSYISLSPEKKKEFIREIKAAYEKIGNKKFSSKREVFICCGFKK